MGGGAKKSQGHHGYMAYIERTSKCILRFWTFEEADIYGALEICSDKFPYSIGLAALPAALENDRFVAGVLAPSSQLVRGFHSEHRCTSSFRMLLPWRKDMGWLDNPLIDRICTDNFFKRLLDVGRVFLSIAINAPKAFRRLQSICLQKPL